MNISAHNAIPRHYADLLVAACTSQGHAPATLLQAAGLNEAEWRLGGDLSPVQFGRLFQRALWLMQDESLGMMGGEGVPNGSFRMLCLCVVQCQTLGAAMARAAQYCDVAIGYRIKPVVSRRGLTARVGMESTQHAKPTAESDSSPTQHALTLLIWLNFISWLVGHPLPVERVLMQSRSRNTDSDRGFFDCDVRYGAPCSALEFPTDVLEWPVKRTKADVERFLDDALAILISPRRASTSWTSRVLVAFADAGQGKLPASTALARQLNVSQATLRRRLADESTSVQQLKDQHRCNLAMRYLASTRLTLKDVGARCGFDNPADFNRAFRRWSGQSPGRFRQSLTEI